MKEAAEIGVVAERYAKGATIVELAQEYEVGAGRPVSPPD
jgi:hypothetical protein